MSENIRVEDDTYAAFDALKREDETFDGLLDRLVTERYALVSEGAGLWDGTDAADGARRARETTKDEITEL